MLVPRKKVKLAFICNAAARKASLKKRTKGMLTKVNELSTLCGVEACMIMYGPDDSQPIVWATPPGAHHVLALFESMSEESQNKYRMDQQSFLQARLAKIENRLEKQSEDTQEKELTRLMFSALTGKRLESLSLDVLEALWDLVGKYLLDIKKKTERLNCQTEVSEEMVEAQHAPMFGVNMGRSEEEAMLSIGENNFSPDWSTQLFY